jgi:hypothetical protein
MINRPALLTFTNDNDRAQKRRGRNTTIFNTSDHIKRLKYSSRPMDITYCSSCLSLSKDGHFLAICWLSNPRLGKHSAMKYCSVYDLSALPFDDGTYSYNLMPLSHSIKKTRLLINLYSSTKKFYYDI